MRVISCVASLFFALLLSELASASVVNTVQGQGRGIPHDYPSRTNCLVSNKTLERFQYITFYSWHTRDGNWSQIGQASDYQESIQFHELRGRGSMLEAQGIFFESIPFNKSNTGPNGHPIHGFTLRPDWEESWANTVNTLTNKSVNGVGNLVEEGVIIGFMLGDELVWNNVTWDWLNMTAAAIKTTFPNTFIMYTEGGAPLYANHNINGYKIDYPYVPHAIDYFSSDDYQSMYLPDGKSPQWFYNSFVYGKIQQPHQSAWVIPPSFKNKGGRFNNSDEWCLNETYAYLDWIEQDECLTGSDAFYFDIDGGLLTLPKTLACWKEVSEQMIAYQKDHPLPLSPLDAHPQAKTTSSPAAWKCPHARRQNAH